MPNVTNSESTSSNRVVRGIGARVAARTGVASSDRHLRQKSKRARRGLTARNGRAVAGTLPLPGTAASHPPRLAPARKPITEAALIHAKRRARDVATDVSLTYASVTGRTAAANEPPAMRAA